MSDPLYAKSYFVRNKDLRTYEDIWDLRLVDEDEATEIIKRKDALLEEKDKEIKRFHGNLNEYTERGAEAERKLKNCQQNWLDERIRLLGQAERIGDKLKTATDALKEIKKHMGMITAPIAKKALADIEGEKELTNEDREDIADAKETMNHTMDPNIKLTDYHAYRKKRLAEIEGEIPKEDKRSYTSASNRLTKAEKEANPWMDEPDWEWLKREAEKQGECFGRPIEWEMSRAILWLKNRADDERSRIILLGERIEHLENTLEDIQAEIIKDEK